MASDPVSDHGAIVRVPDRTPASLASLAQRTLATFKDSEAGVDEGSAIGWQCPTHHKAIERVARTGRRYRACPDCDEFEHSAPGSPSPWWADLSDEEVRFLRIAGEHVHRDWSVVGSVDVPCTDPECSDIPFMAEVRRRTEILAADRGSTRPGSWYLAIFPGLAIYSDYMDDVIELERLHGRWLADAAMADPRLGRRTRRTGGKPPGWLDTWDVGGLMDELLLEKRRHGEGRRRVQIGRASSGVTDPTIEDPPK